MKRCYSFSLRAWTLCLLVLLGTVPAAHAEDSKAKKPLGTRIGDFKLQDFRGKTWDSSTDFAEPPVMVVAFLGVECPLVRLYASRLEEMHQKFGEQVAFVSINANQQDSLAEMAHFARKNEITFPMLKDPGNAVADQFKAARTPEIFVFDKDRKLRYRGRIDDQYTYGIQRPKVSKSYLKVAVEQLLDGKEVSTPETEVVGCVIGRKLKPKSDSKVTYSNQISRIFQKRCVECHRSGEIAPFELTDYDEVVGWAEMIAEVVELERMPPWHADPKHGEFSNDARLTDKEKELIYEWVEAGAPEGDRNQLPPAREFEEGWRIGKPDMILWMRDTPFSVPAEGEVKYRHFEVDPKFTEDKWIKAAECRPGNRSVVHHIIVAYRPGRRGSRSEAPRSSWLAATAPGAQPLILGDGKAKRIPAGSRLIFQLHYTPNGRPQKDRSSVGFIFADEKDVKFEVATQEATNHGFRIPPGAGNHRVTSSYTFRQDADLLTMFPHMHLRGKAFQYTAVYPDKRTEVLLDVPAYDFNWQNAYRLAKPKHMPSGTRIECVAHFDNSEENLSNPNHEESVRWGDQTWEEMMIGYFDISISRTKQKSRTAEFLARIAKQPAEVSPELRAAAANAVDSDDNLKELAERVRRLAPQVDRVDWVYTDSRQLHVARVWESQRRLLSGKGIRLPAGGMALASYASGKETVVNPDISKLGNGDMRFLKRNYRSGIHVPRTIDGKRGVISFWSSEKDAFPAAAVELLESIAAAVSPK